MSTVLISLSSGLYEELITVRKYSVPSSNIIVALFIKRNFLHILYTYKLKTLKYILEYLEEQEAFEECALVRDTINKYNKATGENLKLKE